MAACTAGTPAWAANGPGPTLAGGKGGAALFLSGGMPLAGTGGIAVFVVAIGGVARAAGRAAGVADEPGVGVEDVAPGEGVAVGVKDGEDAAEGGPRGGGVVGVVELGVSDEGGAEGA